MLESRSETTPIECALAIYDNHGFDPCSLRQAKHMVTGSTPWSQFISISQLSHCMKDTLLRLSELICPKPNGGQVLSDIVNAIPYKFLV